MLILPTFVWTVVAVILWLAGVAAIVAILVWLHHIAVRMPPLGYWDTHQPPAQPATPGASPWGDTTRQRSYAQPSGRASHPGFGGVG